MKFKFFISLFFLLAVQSSFGNTCERDCNIGGPDYPCPTWSEPFRTCRSTISDPVCQTHVIICKQKFPVCVASALLAYAVTPTCVGALYETGPSPFAVAACGVSAELIQQTYNNCQ